MNSINSLNQEKKKFSLISAAILHICITFVMTFPASLHLHSHFIGAPRGDKFQFIWNFWWAKYAIFELGQLPLFTYQQYYPTGTSLALHDMCYFWTAISIPLQFFLDPALILNFFLILCFPLNGLAFYRLALEVTKSHRGALVGSVIFAYCPYFVGRFHVCHLQYLSAFFIPMFLLELWRYRHSDKIRNLLKAGVYYSLTSLISFYYGAALTLILFVFLVAKAIAFKNKMSLLERWKQLILHISWTFIIIGFILAPFILPGLLQLNRGDYKQIEEPLNNARDNSGDLVSYFVPDTSVIALWKGWFYSEMGTKLAKTINSSLSGNKLEKSVYPSLIGWLAIFAGLTFKRIRKQSWAWLALAFVFWLITLGPTLFILGKPYLEGLMPFQFLMSLPPFDNIRGPTRFACFIALGAGLLVATWISYIKERWGLTPQRILTLVAILAVFLEFFPLPTSLSSNRFFHSTYYEDLKKVQEGCPILNIPVDFSGAGGGGDVYIYAQTIHQKPIAGGHISRVPSYALEVFEESSVLQSLTSNGEGKLNSPEYTDDSGVKFREAIEHLKINIVIVNKSFLSVEAFRHLSFWLEKGLGPPVFEDGLIVAYSVKSECR